MMQPLMMYDKLKYEKTSHFNYTPNIYLGLTRMFWRAVNNSSLANWLLIS